MQAAEDREEMSDELEDDRITSRVLSDSYGMAVDEHEELFDAIYDEVRAEESEDAPDAVAQTREADPAGPAWPRLVALAALLLLVAVPAAIWFTQGDDPQPEFRARGGGSSFQVVCLEGDAEKPCGPGRSLNLVAQPSDDAKYFAAFGRTPDRTIHWYQPAAPDGTSHRLRDQAGATLPRNIKLSENLQGPLTVYGVFSEEPLTRDDIRALFDEEGNPKPSDTVDVVRREVPLK